MTPETRAVGGFPPAPAQHSLGTPRAMGLSPESVGPKGVGSRGAGNSPRLGSRDATHLLGLSPLLTSYGRRGQALWASWGSKYHCMGTATDCVCKTRYVMPAARPGPPTDSICTVHKSTPSSFSSHHVREHPHQSCVTRRLRHEHVH